MKKKEIIIVGNKPNNNLNLGVLIDGFLENHRCNFGFARTNNSGEKKSKLGLCSHMYINLIKNKLSLNALVEEYKTYFEVDFIKTVYNNFNQKDFKKIYLVKSNRLTRFFYNILLFIIGCEFYFKKLPRTGMVIILHQILKSRHIYVSNFSVNYLPRKSFYIKNTKDFDSIHHDNISEVKILRWLHLNKYIDLTFCLLEDCKDLVLNCNDQIKPSINGINKLIELNIPIYIKGADDHYFSYLKTNLKEHIFKNKIIFR